MSKTCCHIAGSRVQQTICLFANAGIIFYFFCLGSNLFLFFHGAIFFKPMLWVMYLPPRGGGVLHQIFCSQVHHVKQNWTQSNLRFCKNEGSKRFKINIKGVNCIENQGENSYKMLRIC